MLKRLYVPLLTGLVAFVFLNCGESLDNSSDTHSLPEAASGKSDNYIGTNSREYELLGKTNFELDFNANELSGEHRQKRLKRAASRHVSVLSSAIENHIDRVISEHNSELTERQKKYFTYFRDDSGRVSSVDASGQTATVEFELEFVGSRYLMALLAGDEQSAERTFEVSTRQGATIEIEIRGSDSRNAFPAYSKMFEDGVFDIGLHFGGDYNEERLDIEAAKWTVKRLIEDGWANPSIDGFEQLGIDSGPFRKELEIEGQTVRFEVHITHANMVEDSNQKRLRTAVEKSFRERDVVFYAGHAGSNAGFILDYDPKYELDASEFDDIEMADKYQIFVLDGCRTYRTYIEDLMANPNKDLSNTDILSTIHTTPFSAGYHVRWRFLHWLTLTDDSGRHYPVSWKTLIRGLNKDFEDVHYGVHGIDDSPKLNPHGGRAAMCQSCQSDADCGGGGNLCLDFPNGGRCGLACATDTACPDGYRCARIYDREEYFHIPKQCIPRDNTCGG